jgi:hypothetical protein
MCDTAMFATEILCVLKRHKDSLSTTILVGKGVPVSPLTLWFLRQYGNKMLFFLTNLAAKEIILLKYQDKCQLLRYLFNGNIFKIHYLLFYIPH